MEWEFTATQIIEGEYEISLTDFTKKLYSKTAEMTAMSIDEVVSLDNIIDESLDPLEDYRIQYFICYYNFTLALATGRSIRQFKAHTKKLGITKSIKNMFMDKKFLAELQDDSEETVLIFMAVLKSITSGLIESGSSTSRLPQMLVMQQLNSFSSVIPNIMKNEKVRNMIMPIEFENSFMSGKLMRIFK
ncbi:hypothetical protein Dacet_0507 [Denitrovibrio acetiphilus DSM 12809]|uniref:Uncharacterized protein n=1 Tax=Denitrovibrio acetiphilus (strain DSM 12809 / NBRC 114555 / N2460) TaxID=522772 RepID=D4H3Z4_DENA2|nr:hypothetical protein [Denitrovibrio acetiphilus]ADD67305.1 hypothetical protein Dacet_0507 [Denitrovibrio acetiphilus DSM 12809]